MLFNYRSMEKLLRMAAPEEREYLDKDLKLCRTYESIIIKQQMFLSTKSNNEMSAFDELNYKDDFMKYENKRRNNHNNVIHGIKRWNRLSKVYNLPLIYNGDENDRTEIAECAHEVVSYYFAKGLQFDENA